MIIRKAYKFRLNTKLNQQHKLFQFAGCCRFLWNKCWHINRERLKNGQRIMRYQEMDFWSKLWKKSDEYGFLKDCQSQLLQQKLKDLDKAFMDCFDEKQVTKKFPKRKKKGQDDSFRYPQGFKIQGNNIYLPKLGWFKYRQSRKIQGVPKNVTVSHYAGHWYLSIQTELEIEQPVHPSKSMVGIDVGIAQFATLSTGGHFAAKNHFRKLENKLARAQQSLSRKQKFSNNWHKQKARIQKIHAKIAFARRDRLHWCSHQISKNHAIIVMEDLKVSNMSKSASGDIANPGRNVKAKSGLNKSILDQGWSEFRRQLMYKQQWRGGDVLVVNPKNTSRTCPVEICGHVAKSNRLSQADFVCECCGYTNNADIVGAIVFQKKNLAFPDLH